MDEISFLELVLVSLTKTLAILTCGAAAYCWVRRGPLEPDNRTKIAAEALLMSVLAIYAMASCVQDTPGLLYDWRFVIIALTALFSGRFASVIVTTAVIGFRLSIGGIGMYAGIFQALLVMILANAYHHWVTGQRRTLRQLDVFAMCPLISCCTLLGWLFLPLDVVMREVRHFTILPLAAGDLLGLAVIGSLILWDDQLKELKCALANDDAQFHTVIDNLPVTVAMYDLNGVVTLLNRRYQEIYGPEIMRFVGKDASLLRDYLLFDDGETEVEKNADLVSARSGTITRYVPDLSIGGRVISVLLTQFAIPNAAGEPDGTALIGVDVSELRNREKEAERLQLQLMQAGKMNAVGQLAGGLAHDFNNLLGAMNGFASFLAEDLFDRPSDQAHAKRILDLCDRAKTLVEHILAFARADRVDREVIDICAVVRRAVEFMRSTLPSTTIFSFESTSTAIWLNANETQMHQLVINLCLHASHAVEGQRGQFSVGLNHVFPTEAEAAMPRAPGVNQHSEGGLQAGRGYARISVSDNGPGMDQATLERMMEPFFTTKASPDGSGLGLSIVHGIVLACGGAYSIKSRVGSGTVFEIYLPDIDQADEPPRPLNP